MVRNWGSEGPQTLDHIPAPPEERAAQPGRLFLGPLATQPSFPRGPPVATGRTSRGPLHPSAAERPSQGHSWYSPGCCSFRTAQPPRVSVALRAVVPHMRRRGGGTRDREGCSSLPSPLPALSLLLCGDKADRPAPGCGREGRAAHTAPEGGAASLTDSDV